MVPDIPVARWACRAAPLDSGVAIRLAGTVSGRATRRASPLQNVIQARLFDRGLPLGPVATPGCPTLAGPIRIRLRRAADMRRQRRFVRLRDPSPRRVMEEAACPPLAGRLGSLHATAG